MNTSDVLNKAADLIEERGWGQGAWGETGSLCLEGGILAAAGLPRTHIGDQDMAECPAYMAVHRYLYDDVRVDGTHRAFAWNDKRDRTATEVVEVLRAAALIESAKENADARQVVSA